MNRLPSLKPREVLRALERAGFYVHHQTGSHVNLRHPKDLSLRVVVPMHNRDLFRATLHSILKQSGMTVEEFVGHL